MMDVHSRLAKIARKIAALEKMATISPLTASLVLVQDNICAKHLLAIEDKDWQSLIEGIRTSGITDKTYAELAEKMEVLRCYVMELRRLIEMDLRDLTGLTRDDIAALQRFVTRTRIPVTNRASLIEHLTAMMLQFHEAEVCEADMAGVLKLGKTAAQER